MLSILKKWKSGFKDGIPIMLGYLTVSFTFGISAKNAGLNVWQSVLMSATNVTSAGQFSSLAIITAGSTYVELALTQFVINLRYCLMSSSLTQKLDEKMPFFHRFIMSFGVTDEIFGVSFCRPINVSPAYFYGLMSSAIPGWILGTLLGGIASNFLTASILSALNIALYGMLVAIIIPPARKEKTIAFIVVLSMLISLIFEKIKLLASISSGFKIIIITIIISSLFALLFPREDT